MSTGRYLLGATELAVIAVTLGLGAYHLRALLVPAWMGALARLAEVVIGISMLILVSELLGVLSLFEEVPLLIGYVAVGLGTTYLVRRRGLPVPRRTPEARSSALMVGIGIAWIPVIQGARGLYEYLQGVQAYLAPPIAVVTRL